MDASQTSQPAAERTISLGTDTESIPLLSQRKPEVYIIGEDGITVETDTPPETRPPATANDQIQQAAPIPHPPDNTPPKGPIARQTPPEPNPEAKTAHNPTELPRKSPKRWKPLTDDKPATKKKSVSGDSCQTCRLRRGDWPYCGWLGRPHPPALSIHQVQVSQRILLDVLCQGSTGVGPDIEPTPLVEETQGSLGPEGVQAVAGGDGGGNE